MDSPCARHRSTLNPHNSLEGVLPLSLFSEEDRHVTLHTYALAASWGVDTSGSSGNPDLPPSVSEKVNPTSMVISRAAPSWAPSADCPPSLGQRPNLAFIPAAVGETPAAGRNQVDFEKEETEARGWLGHSLWGQVLSNSINSS